jgi:hypothetical protein
VPCLLLVTTMVCPASRADKSQANKLLPTKPFFSRHPPVLAALCLHVYRHPHVPLAALPARNTSCLEKLLPDKLIPTNTLCPITETPSPHPLLTSTASRCAPPIVGLAGRQRQCTPRAKPPNGPPRPPQPAPSI